MNSVISQDKAAANQGGVREPETWLRGANTGEPKAPRRGRGTARLAYQPCKFYSHQPAPFHSALCRGARQDRFLLYSVLLVVSARAQLHHLPLPNRRRHCSSRAMVLLAWWRSKVRADSVRLGRCRRAVPARWMLSKAKRMRSVERHGGLASWCTGTCV